MITVPSIPTGASSAEVPSTSARATGRTPSLRLAGAGALVFVGSVVFQNLLRGSSAPANDASAAEVAAHHADHRAVTYVLAASFLVGAIGLITFLAGARQRLVTSSRPVAADAGFIGAGVILALFPLEMASEEALSVLARAPSPDLGAVSAVWAFHNTVFTVLWVFIAVATFGLARAGVAAGITPRVFDWLAPVAAVLLAGPSLAGPAIAAGEGMALFGVVVAGFVLWLAFLASTGVRLIRSNGTAPHAEVRS